MTTTHAGALVATLQDSFDASEDGSLWLALSVVEREGGVVTHFEGEPADPVAAARLLARLIDGTRADSAYLAICRPQARPTRADRVMWAELCRAVRSNAVADLVIFNSTAVWSMRGEAAVRSIA